MDKFSLLQTLFGHNCFRPGQEQLIDAMLAGRDAFGVMPTGAGKSMCYQIPALLLPGVTLVISPLISLMKDQVMNLCQLGIPAAYLNSSLTYNQYCEALRRACLGAYKIIYVAPERLTTPGFLHFAETVPISLVAVDEAHCVSQWGQDFRPSYLQIADFVANLPQRPVLAAFTATATKEVRRDIHQLLRLQDPETAVTGFDRENLTFSVEHPAKKPDFLLQLLRQRSGKSGIVYCATRTNVEKVCDLLCSHGFPATRYHAGLSEEERRVNQDAFSYDEKPIMVATNAFGMGIDKSNVAWVIHYNMPKNLESYYQEAGRAGRDGSPAECILLFSRGDVHTAQFLIQQSTENENLTPAMQDSLRKRDLQRLEDMVAYCRTKECLRAHILRYFGEKCPDQCGNCGNCLNAYQELDVTEQAEIILKAVQTLENRYDRSFGITIYTRLLHGSREKAITAWGMEELPIFGKLRQLSVNQLRELMEQMTLLGLLAEEQDGGYTVLTLGPMAPELLQYGQPVRIRQAIVPVQPLKPDFSGNQALLAELKQLRLQLAQQRRVPAYQIFSNATLEDMAAKTPTSMEALLRVSGVGTRKAHQYGAQFLEIIRHYTNCG